MKRYQVVTTAPTPGLDQDGNPIELPAGTVINTILWDGVAPYEPPPNTQLVAE